MPRSVPTDPQAYMAEPDQSHEASPPLHQRLTAFDTALLFGGIVLFLALLIAMWEFLNPPLLGAAAAILLWPLRAYHGVRALLVAGGFLLLLWFFDRLSAVLIPFVIVYLIAYLFNPVVTFLRARWRVPRWISSLVVTLLIVGVVALVALLLVPNVVSQLETLGARVLNSIDRMRVWLASTPLLDRIEEAGLISKEELLDQFTATARHQVESLTGRLPTAARGLAGSLGSVIGGITIVAITPVVLFYTLKDFPFIKRRLVGVFPTFGGRRDYLVKAGSIVGNYLRGLLIISAIAAFNVSVALLLFDVPFALLIGIMGGLLNLIPNLGIIMTYLLGGFITVILGDPWYVDTAILIAVLLGQSLLEQSVLTPNILGYQVGLHPVLIILSLFIFGYFMGIFGLLIAVPATALLMTFYRAYGEELTLDLSAYDAPAREHIIRGRERAKEAAGRKPEPTEAPEVEPTES